MANLFGNWFNRDKKVTGKVTQFAERDNSGDWFMYFNQFQESVCKIEKFSNANAYELATSIAEIFYPIDYIADACGGLDFLVVREDDLSEVESLPYNIERLIKSPNPHQKFSDLVYLGVFSKLADGNAYDYVKIPDSYKNITTDNITNIWSLQPNVTRPVMLKEIPNPFGIKSTNELIKRYDTFFFNAMQLEPKFVYHHSLLNITTNGKSKSPLEAVELNINNLIQVYSARYNVYKKNMNAGILSYDGAKSTDISMQLGDVGSRDEIIKDLKNRNGLTGDRNFIGVTNIPLKFIKTIASIDELKPFEETEADAVAIAGIFGVPSSIVPKKSEPKYSNSEQAEKKVWQNIIKPMAIERGKELAKVYQLPEGVVFYPDFSKVEILQEDKKTSYESDTILLDNLARLKEQGEDVSKALTKLKEKYNSIDI